ncbi:MAG: phosphotransferase [Candidatus Zixiibacteriota bacterium]|nr:MAG: phosphotransferase [candidate division Zixibacteria bacterium]
MLRETEETFDRNSREVLAEVQKRYGIEPGDLKRLGSFASFVFEYRYRGVDRVLRITPGSHRSVDQIRGELEWMNYLNDSGVSVIRGLPSNRGLLVEPIEIEPTGPATDNLYSVVSFTRAPGAGPAREVWNANLFKVWGQTIGRMHAATKDYRPSDPALRRHTWYEDEDLCGREHIPPDQNAVRQKYDSLMKYLRSLPTPPDAFGVVHEDMHHGNFFVDDGRITVFDFDDCQYHWFAADLSIPLFYVMRNKVLNDRSTEFARHFFGCLMEGYNRENSISRKWLEQIPCFLKLREMILYIIIYAEGIQDSDEWCRDFMENRRERIEKDIPVVDIDFSQFA